MEYILETAGRKGVECEVFAEDTRGVSVEVHLGRTESVERFRDRGIGIRVMTGRRIGYAFTSDLGPEALDRTFEESHSISISSSPLPEDALGDFLEMDVDPAPSSRDPIESDIGVIVDSVKEMEEASLHYSDEVVNTQNVGFSEDRSVVTVGSTRGFIRSEERGLCTYSISAISKRGDEIRSGWYWAQGALPEEIDVSAVGKEAGRRSADLLGSSKVSGGRYPVIFDRMAFIDIIGFMEEMLSAEMVIKGMSRLAGEVGGIIAPACFSLIDDPFSDKAGYRSSFDDEGVPRKRYELIREGRLNGFLHSSMTARILELAPTGSADRSSFMDQPSPGATNLHAAPGEGRLEKMISEVSKGIYVQDIMGMHTADPISGDFSVGISGWYVKSGTLDHPVCEMTVSGNIIDTLKGIRAVGEDLVFIGSLGAPSVLVEGLSLSGK